MNKLILLSFPLLLSSSLPSPTKNEMAQQYAHAISDYIKAVYKEHKLSFDTLYFIKHVDFPDIQLPPAIGNTRIRLLSFEESMSLQKVRTAAFFINMIAWLK